MTQDKRQHTQTKTCESPLEHKNRILYCGGGQTLKEVAQSDGEVSIYEDFRSPAGHGPWLWVVLLEQGFGIDYLKRSRPMIAIL